MIGQQILLVSPVRALAALLELIKTRAFYRSLANSFGRILLGFASALAVGVALALLAYASELIRRLFAPVMAAIRATPVASFAILLLVFVGSGSLSIYTAFLMVMPVIYANVLAGLQNADPKMLEMAKVIQLNRARRLRAILIPSAFPYLLSACASGLGICWKAGVAAEVIGQSANSIGDALYRAKLFFATDELFAWTLAIILISLAFEKGVLWLIGLVRARIERSAA
jgi:NitT/TauT family transport system permease protein